MNKHKIVIGFFCGLFVGLVSANSLDPILNVTKWDLIERFNQANLQVQAY